MICMNKVENLNCAKLQMNILISLLQKFIIFSSKLHLLITSVRIPRSPQALPSIIAAEEGREAEQ